MCEGTVEQLCFLFNGGNGGGGFFVCGSQVARWRGENWWGLGLDGADAIKAMNKACVSILVCL